MSWKDYIKEYNMGLGKNIYLQKQIRIDVVNYIKTLNLDEKKESKVIDYVSDERYANKISIQDITTYVHDTMQKLGM